MRSEQLYGNPTILEIQLYGREMAEKRALVRSIRGGDKVTALFPAGLGLKQGKTVQDWKARTGVANALLLFPETPHVVIDLGGKYGTGGVVDVENIIGVRRKV